MPIGIGPMEVVIVLVIALVVLGPQRLPEAGKAVGKGMREFKDSITGPRSTTTKGAPRRTSYEPPGSWPRDSLSSRTTCAAHSSALSAVVSSCSSARSGGS